MANDLASADGYRLRRGRYFYYRDLQLADSVASVEALLADQATMDLAPRFKQLVQNAA